MSFPEKDPNKFYFRRDRKDKSVWRLDGPAAEEGESVQVELANGDTKEAIIGRLLTQFDDGRCLYSITPTPAPPTKTVASASKGTTARPKSKAPKAAETDEW